MGSRQLRSFAITSMLWSVIPSCSLFGQAQPAPSYTFLNVVVGTTGQYTVEDFLTNWVNINPAIITVRTTLDADDPSYSYSAQCLRAPGQECRPCNQPCPPPPDPCLPICQDTCILFEDTMSGFEYAVSHNYWGVSIPINRSKFVGKMIVESLGGQPFYAASPNVWKVSGSSTVSACEAFYRAWENTSWTDQWYLDSAAGVFLTAFANHWHNGMFWDLGWNSHLSIRNDNANPPSVDVQIVYVTDYGTFGGPWSWNPDDACNQSTLSDRLTLTIPPLASQSTSLNLILGSNWLHTVQEDGFFYFVPPANVFPLGTYSVTPNASARAEHCGADSCPQTVCN